MINNKIKIKSKLKKGFTITEIIVTLVILGIVLVIAIPGVGTLQKKFKQEYYDKLDNTIIEASKSYYKDMEQELPTGIIGVEKLEYNSLITQKYIDLKSTNSGKDFIGYNDKEVCSGHIVALKSVGEIKYINCMSCNDEAGNDIYMADVPEEYRNLCALGDNHKVIENYSEEPLYIYAGTYTDSEKLKDNLKVKKTAYLYNTDAHENIVEEIYKIEVDGEYIYPKNISAINLLEETVEAESGNNIGKTVVYSDNKTRKVHVFKYPAPTITGEIVDSDIIYSGGSNKLNLEPQSLLFEGNIGPDSYPNGSIFAPDGSSFDKYQYYDYSTSKWNDICNGTQEWDCSLNATQINGILNGKTKIKFRIVGKASDGTLYFGKETKEYSVKPLEVTVFFDLNGVTATPLASKKVVWNTTYGTLPTPTATGYSFIGWFDDNYRNNSLNFYADTYWDLKNAFNYNQDALWDHYLTYGRNEGRQISQYTSETIVTKKENHTLYAGWFANSYTLTYDSQGGTTCSQKTEKYGLSWGTLCSTTKGGYTFSGWYTQPNGAGTRILDGTTVAGNLTVYANWSPNNYTVKFNGNGATSGSMNSQPFKYDESKALTANAFAKSGSAFIGWSTSASGGVVYNDKQTVSNLSTTSNAVINLYAVWGKIVSGSVTSGCKTETLAEGIYYIEIIGGGAGALGSKGFHPGGNAARWSGYVQLPSGSTKFCGGSGSVGLNGGSNIGMSAIDILLGIFGTETNLSGVDNGTSSYIENSSGTKLVDAYGGRSPSHTPYDASVVSFASGVNKKECVYIKGKSCGVKGSQDDCNWGRDHDPGTLGYGIGGATAAGGNSNGNGYWGTHGIVNYKYVSSVSDWNSNPRACPATTICSNALCKWTS